MSNLMGEAIASLRRDVRPEHQDAVARAVMALAGRDMTSYALTPEERLDLEAADAEVAGGEFASDESVRTLWAKYGV